MKGRSSRPAKSAAPIALDDALEPLAKTDPSKEQAVDLRYLRGLSMEQRAEVLHVHPNTVIRDRDLATQMAQTQVNAGGIDKCSLSVGKRSNSSTREQWRSRWKSARSFWPKPAQT